MLAYGEGDHVRENAWLEASRLIESKEFAAKGKEGLKEICNFQASPKLATGAIPSETRTLVDGLPDSGRPFAMADRSSYRAWAFGVLGKIYCYIRRIVKKTGAERAYGLGDDVSPYDFVENKYTSIGDRHCEAARLYVHAGHVISAAEFESCKDIRLLHRRRGGLVAQAAAAYAEGGGTHPHSQLLTNSNHFVELADALKSWHRTCCVAAQSLATDEQDRELKIAALKAELQGYVRDVVASDLYTHPEGDHEAWVRDFLAQLTARAATAAESPTLIAGKELGRHAYYLLRMKDVNPALSPAHEKMRDCWKKSAAAVDPGATASQQANTAPRTTSIPPRNMTALSKVSLWLAINYAHLADGLYADAAAYFLRAGQATAAGDVEQAKCWQTAAEALMRAADANITDVEEAVPHMLPSDRGLDEVHPDKTSFEKDAAPWVRCGETLALLGAAGCSGGHCSSDCVALRRALVRLSAQLERGTRGAAEKMAFAYGLGGLGGLRAKMIATGERLLDALASVATAARSGSCNGLLPAERVVFLARLGVVVEDLCGKYSTIEARLWKDHNGEIVPTRCEDSRRLVGAGESVVAGLEKAVAALSAKSDQGAEEAYLEAQRQNEVAADLVAKASQSAEASV